MEGVKRVSHVGTADASGWIFRFIKAMRDERGEILPNAHTIGFLRRICKLLFLNIRPVFVFDGSTPALKKRTLVERRRRREQQDARVRKTAEKLLMNKLQQHALAELKRQANGQEPGQEMGSKADMSREQSLPHDSTRKANGESDEVQSEKSDKCENEDRVLAETVSMEERSEDDAGFEIDLEEGVDPEVLSTLPHSMQLEVMLQLREKAMVAARGGFEARNGKPLEFSQYQLQQYLNSTGLRRRLDSIRGINTQQPNVEKPIAAEEDKKYILVRQDEDNEANKEIPESINLSTQGDKDEKGIQISFTVQNEEADNSDGFEWEDVEEERYASSIAKKRSNFWTLSHGFQRGRKLGNWGEETKTDIPETEEEMVQRAINESLKDFSNLADSSQHKIAESATDAAILTKTMPQDPSDMSGDAPSVATMNDDGVNHPIQLEQRLKEASDSVKVVQSNNSKLPDPKEKEPLELVQQRKTDHDGERIGRNLTDDTKESVQIAGKLGLMASKMSTDTGVFSTPKEKDKIPIVKSQNRAKEDHEATLKSPNSTHQGGDVTAKTKEVFAKSDDDVSSGMNLSESIVEKSLPEEVKESTEPSDQNEILPIDELKRVKMTNGAVIPKDYGEDKTIARASIEFDQTNLEKEEVELRAQRRAAAGQSDSPTDQMFIECQELLQMFGIPYIIAPSEAEAQCAWMDSAGLVDGVVTDDNDSFLFGARRVYRHIFEENKYVEEYRTEEIENELGLSRDKLILLALLLGSDYTPGISGVGIVNAIEIVSAFPDYENLVKFAKWMDNIGEDFLSALKGKEAEDSNNGISQIEFKQKHRSLRKSWVLPEDFPSKDVVSAYESPLLDECNSKITFGMPSFESIKDFCTIKLGWDLLKVDNLLSPVSKAIEEKEKQQTLDSFVAYREKFAKIRSKRLSDAISGMVGGKSKQTGASRKRKQK